MMTLASKIAHDNRSQGSKIVSMTFVKQEKSEHLQQLLEQDKSINNGVSQEEMSELNKTDYEKEIVGDAQKEDGTSPNINCVSLTEVHLPESEPPRYVCNKKKLEFKNTFLKCLYLKFSTKPDSGILSGKKAFLAEEIAKISLGHIKSSLFSWEVIQYNNLSSNIIGPILLTILRHCKPSEGNGEDEAAAISEECLEIAKFFLMLYADELCEQIFNDVAAGGIDLIPDCSEKHRKSPKDVIQGHITKKGMMEQVDMIEPQKYQPTESSQLRSPKSTNIQLPKSAETQLSEIPTNLSPKQHLISEELIVPDEEETAITIANEIEVAQAVEPVPSVSTECTGEPMDQGLMQASMYDLIKVLAHTILQGALMLSEPNTLTTIGSPSHSVSSDTCEACLDSKWYYSTISGAVAEYKGNNAFGLSKIIAKKIRPDCVRHLLEHMKPSHFGPHHQMWTSQVKTIHPVDSISEIKVTNLNICEDKYKKELQVILQWSVASELDVAEMFLVVNDEAILEKLEKLEMQVRTKKQCVGDLLQAVLNYHQEREKAELREELLDWLLNNM
ncbi:A-kinase anchor protein 4 [Bombina bombina]|uniref:A-kinase anchor protein 4 n=1 Tax=Bombina bombina TaxID=8345 RepID=UPI00235B284D|nr:A-kinase anchor protein 4 [Bombina bombina]